MTKKIEDLREQLKSADFNSSFGTKDYFFIIEELEKEIKKLESDIKNGKVKIKVVKERIRTPDQMYRGNPNY